MESCCSENENGACTTLEAKCKTKKEFRYNYVTKKRIGVEGGSLEATEFLECTRREKGERGVHQRQGSTSVQLNMQCASRLPE